MTSIQKKSFNQPDDIKTPEKVRAEIVTIEGITMQRVTADSGWQWSKHLKPILGTDSCQMHHLLYVISGRLASQMAGGDVEEFGPGDLAVIPAGHDGWTVGEEPVVWLELPH